MEKTARHFYCILRMFWMAHASQGVGQRHSRGYIFQSNDARGSKTGAQTVQGTCSTWRWERQRIPASPSLKIRLYIYKMLYRPFIHTFECACFPENFQIHALLFPMVSLELPTSTPSVFRVRTWTLGLLLKVAAPLHSINSFSCDNRCKDVF